MVPPPLTIRVWPAVSGSRSMQRAAVSTAIGGAAASLMSSPCGMGKNFEDGVFGGPADWVTDVVGNTEHKITEVDVRNALAECVLGSGDIEIDSSWRRNGQEAHTHGPIRRVECAGMNAHTDLIRAWVGNGNIRSAEN
jgi:hypothetical protein